MSSTLRTAMLSAAILAAPLAAFAQSNNPMGNIGSNGSVTATPSTASPHAAMDASAKFKTPPAMAKNPTVSGATGNTVVHGTNSTVAGDRAGTVETKTGQVAAGGGK